MPTGGVTIYGTHCQLSCCRHISGLYVDKDDLIRDIQLVWSNAKTFNPKVEKLVAWMQIF